jgi:phage terminase large subunit-like protein
MLYQTYLPQGVCGHLTLNWAEEVIDEVASFPAGEHDDYVDSVSLALMRFRKGGFIRTSLDEEDEPREFRRRNMYAYY